MTSQKLTESGEQEAHIGSQPDHPQENTRDLESVLADFQQRVRHTLSKELRENPSVDEKEYTILPEYERFVGDPAQGRFDYKNDNPNTGWKLHLNIRPEDAVAVSTYLKEKGYYHKFLSGGYPSKGKVFTIYIGSYSLTEKLAQELHHDLQGYLCQPKANDDIEFFPGVVGRFNRGVKSNYGPFGFSIGREDNMIIFRAESPYSSKKQTLPPNFKVDASRRAMKKLYKEHGDYFLKKAPSSFMERPDVKEIAAKHSDLIDFLEKVFEKDQSDPNHMNNAAECYAMLIARQAEFIGTPVEADFWNAVSFEAFHMAQSEAFKENTEKTLAHLEVAYSASQKGFSRSWEAYVKGTKYYFEKDIEGLKNQIQYAAESAYVLKSLLQGLESRGAIHYLEDYANMGNF